MFDADKDVLLVERYPVPKNNPLYDTLELKDGIFILEESVLQAMQHEDTYILVCGDFNARTGREQPKLEEMVNYMPCCLDDSDACLCRCSKDRTINKFEKYWLNMFYAGLYYCARVL